MPLLLALPYPSTPSPSKTASPSKPPPLSPPLPSTPPPPLTPHHTPPTPPTPPYPSHPLHTPPTPPSPPTPPPHPYRYLSYIQGRPKTGQPLYAVLRDAAGATLSVSPVINAEGCRVTADSVNVLVEVSGTEGLDLVQQVRWWWGGDAATVEDRGPSNYSVCVCFEGGAGGGGGGVEAAGEGCDATVEV